MRWVGLFPPPPLRPPAQPPSWAWETSRRNWTAYPAGRRTQTCPTPTRRPPPTARTHEGNAVPPPPPFFFSPLLPLPPPPQLHLSHPPCLLPLHPLLSASTLLQRCKERKRDVGGGGGEAGVDARFCLPVIPELPVRTPTPLFHLLHFFSTWPLRLRGTIFFFFHCCI